MPAPGGDRKAADRLRHSHNGGKLFCPKNPVDPARPSQLGAGACPDVAAPDVAAPDGGRKTAECLRRCRNGGQLSRPQESV